MAQFTDYPGTATDHGSVIVRLSISADGSLDECQVTRASGVESLDLGACAIMEWGRFNPGRDEQGQAVPSTIDLTIHFIAPHAPPTEADLPIEDGDITILYNPPRDRAQRENGVIGPGQARQMQRLPATAQLKYPSGARRRGEEGRVHATIDVNAKGQPQRCTVVRSSGSEELDTATCRYAMKHVEYVPGTDYYGKAIGGVDLFSLEWAINPSAQN